MKKLISLLIGVLCLWVLGYGGSVSVTTTTLTRIGSTVSYYIGITNSRGLPSSIVSFDIGYTKGDETNVYFTVGYWNSATAPTSVTGLSYFPESDSTGTITKMTRYIAATGQYTCAIEIPDSCYYVVITFDHTGGTPTGTVGAEGRLNAYR